MIVLIFLFLFTVESIPERPYVEVMDKEMKERMNSLMNRLGREMYDTPENDKPNSH